MSDRFSGMTAIVTGAGSGIGLEVTRRLASEGARVIAADIFEDRIDSVVDELGVIGVVGDISTQEAVDNIIDTAGERIDVLANVAGIMDGFLPVHELDDATWERVLAVNLTAPMRLTRAVLPAMMAANKGSIVNVSSEAGLKGGVSGSAYTASKHALIGLTRSTAVLYVDHGIRANAVCPGGVATGIDANSRSEFGLTVIQRHLPSMPTFVTPDVLASTICWLASDDSANVNGAIVPSDGGWSAV